MTKAEYEKLLDQELRAYAKQQKQERDEDTLRAYEKKLQSTVKNYRFEVSGITTGGRKNRALAVGECILQAAEKLDKEKVNHNFVPGSLGWSIVEDRVKDEDGRKGYKYTVTCVVATDEKAFDDQQILKELEDLRQKLEKETEEMFQEEAEEPPAEVVDREIQ